MTTFDLSGWAATRKAEVDALLDARLPASFAGDDPGRLVEAMRYSLLAPGKRVRPLLALATAETLGAPLDEAQRLAAASVELVHCYSLVHDDLPSMDDDDFRRGKPTSHKVFGEATAILAGDALLTLAFEWLAEAALLAESSARPGPRRRDFLRATRALAQGAGMWGMVRGQARDLGEPAPRTIEELELLHREKTGALFRASIQVGAFAAGATGPELDALELYSDRYGIAFQHADDLADAEHGDLADAARARVRSLTGEAEAALVPFGAGAEPLRALARALGGGR
jgi:geranylgeranyl pyrophosphate synthase